MYILKVLQFGTWPGKTPGPITRFVSLPDILSQLFHLTGLPRASTSPTLAIGRQAGGDQLKPSG